MLETCQGCKELIISPDLHNEDELHFYCNIINHLLERPFELQDDICPLRNIDVKRYIEFLKGE